MHDKLNAEGHKRGRYMSSETLIHIIYTSNTGSFNVDLSQCRSRKRITELKMLKTDEICDGIYRGRVLSTLSR